MDEYELLKKQVAQDIIRLGELRCKGHGKAPYMQGRVLVAIERELGLGRDKDGRLCIYAEQVPINL